MGLIRTTFLTGSWACLCAVAVLTPAPAADIQLFVLPSGDDSADGSRETPLASLAGARDRIRQLRAGGKPGSAEVIFSHGTYFFSQPTTFSTRDSGTPSGPITYRAADHETVRFTAGRSVRGWQPVTDPATLSRLPDVSHGHVFFADLADQGIGDVGQLKVHGFATPNPLAEPELFYRDRPMTLARWPNDGYRGVTTVIDPVTVIPDSSRPKAWLAETDAWIFAYWHHDWAELHEPLQGIVADTGALVRSADVKPRYGITAGRARWYGYNLLCELDNAGEYYIDRAAGRLYFWPPAGADMSGGEGVVVSQGESIIQADDLSHVIFRGLTVEACRGTAIRITEGSHCHVIGCTIRNVGHSAVSVSGGLHHLVFGCDVYDCGSGGITMAGGDRKTLAPAGHTAENNHVFRYSRRSRTYRAGIAVSGVGNQIIRNLIHHGPHMALSAGGNDHLVEGNEIHNVVMESGDAGAFYVGRDWTQRGTRLRGNYWHDIVGSTGFGGMTIYLDDQHSGHVIEGNLFQRCSRAVFIGGGDDNVVINNLFLDCHPAVHIDNRGMGWQKVATDDPQGTLRSTFTAMPVNSDLWRHRYPNLAGTLDDEPNIPKRNVIRRNISVGGRWDDLHSGTLQYQKIENNLVFDDTPNWATLETDGLGRPTAVRFRDSQAVADVGFQPLRFDQMGVYEDPRRARWPVDHPVEKISFIK